MTLGRAWRTARHLTAEQWLFRARAKSDALFVRAFPDAAHARVARSAGRLPDPDPAAPALLNAARPVRLLQDAIWDAALDDVRRCRFEMLGETFDFGGPEAVAWRGDFREGGNPLRRMTLAYMGYAVPLLATGDAADFRLVRALLASFEAACGGFAAGALRDVWNPYAASHRLINLLAGLALHRAAGGAPEAADEAALLDHARFCAAHVRARLERDIQYNHLLKNLVALSVYAAACRTVPPDFACLSFGVSRSLRQCVLPDGGHAERSPMYHALGLLDAETLAGCALFGDRWRDEAAETAGRMRAALAVLAHPDGDIALFNDAWLGDAPPARALIGDMSSPPPTARLAESGYVRLGQGGDAVIFDCGPCGPDAQPGHAHADFLSVEASVGGQRLIVDPGTASYTAGPLRAETRNAAGHNGPAFDGIEPLEFWLAFRVGRRTAATEITGPGLGEIAPLWCAGKVTLAEGGLHARRWVGLWPGRAMLVCDLWTGVSARAAQSRFLVPAGWSVSHGGRGTLGLAQQGVHVRCTALAGVLDAPSAARHWPRFGCEAAAHALTLRPGGSGGARRAALWLHWDSATLPPDGAALAALFDRLAAC